MAEEIYVRNGRPNTVVVKYGDLRIPLAHRGGLGRDLRESPGDSCALPGDAATDPTISRWLKNGTLEKISKEAYLSLRARNVEVLPNKYLAQSVRSPRGGAVPMDAAEADTTKTRTYVADANVHKSVREARPEWAGELMTTEEELEEMEIERQEQNYPSKHRDEDQRRQMGY